MVTAPQRYRLSTEQYDRLVEVGVVPEGTRVELLDGELIEMPAQGNRHVSCLRRLIGLVQQAGVPPGTLLVQMPLQIAWDAEPEPDLVVLRPPANQYDARPPGADDVLLLIEVADSSRDYDRDRKVTRYAAAGIPEVWLVDLPDEVLRVYRDPDGGAYRILQVLRRGEVARTPALPSAEIAVDHVLGPADTGVGP
jgi:Uma2 family endonuclease